MGGGGGGGKGGAPSTPSIDYGAQEAARKAEQDRLKAEEKAKNDAEREAEQRRRDELRRQMLGGTVEGDDEEAAVTKEMLG